MPAWLDPQAIATVVMAAGVIGLFRWGRSIDKALSGHAKAAEMLIQRLDSHIHLDEERHEALEKRLDRAEDDLRWNGFRRS